MYKKMLIIHEIHSFEIIITWILRPRPQVSGSRPDLFEGTSFLSALGYRPHGDGIFGQRKRNFSKSLSRVDLFENTVFLFSCGRIKWSFSKTLISQHRFATYQRMRSVLLGSHEGNLISTSSRAFIIGDLSYLELIS